MNESLAELACSPWTLMALGLLLTAPPNLTLRRMRALSSTSAKSEEALPASRGKSVWLRRLHSAHGRAPRRRRSDDTRELRLAASWDLLSACLCAGMPIPTAVRASASTAPPDVERILLRSADLLALGADPVDAWQQARDCPDTAELARAACRAARAGTALADVPSSLAQRARDETNDRAHSRAQRAGVLMAGPLCLCFLPAFLCLGVIPVVLGLAGQLTVLR